MIGIALLAMLLSTGQSARQELRIQLPAASYVVRFDPAKISAERLRGLVELSPYAGDNFEVPEWLELCVEGDPEYKPCGTRAPGAKYFYDNAEVNLRKIARRIKWLETTRFPEELVPVVKHFLGVQRLSLEIQTRRLNYFRTGDARLFATPFSDFDPRQECRTEVDGVLRLVGSREDALREWSNCANSIGRDKIGRYPKDAWEGFLRRYDIQEEYREDDD